MKAIILFIILGITSYSTYSQSITLTYDSVFCKGENEIIIANVQNYDSLSWQYSNNYTDFHPATANFYNNSYNNDTLQINNTPMFVDDFAYYCLIYYQEDTLYSDTAYTNVSSVDFNFPPYNLICNGDSITLIANDGENYLWNTGETNDTLIATLTETTFFSVTVTDQFGCVGEDATYIHVADTIDFNFNIDNNIVSFEASGYNSLTYNWNFGDSINGIGQSIQHIYDTAGTYNVCLTTQGDCVDTVCKTIDEINCFLPQTAIMPVDTFVYPNQNLNLNINYNFQSYLWSNGDTTSNVVYSYDSLNNYESVTVEIDSTCFVTKQFHITKYPCQKFYGTIRDSLYWYEPIYQTQVYNLCKNQPYTFKASILSSMLLNSNSINYNDVYYHQDPDSCQYYWDFNDGSTIEYGNSVTHTYTNAGFRKINLTAIDQYGCESILFTQMYTKIANEPDININSINDTIFLGDTVNLTSSTTIDSIPVYNKIFINEKHMRIPTNLGNIISNTFINIPLDYIYDSLTLKNVNINMNHSYLGDIDIKLTNPCGQTVNIFEQYGSGTHLGEPIDDDNSNEPGIGYNYTFSMNASQTLAEASNGAQTIPEGYYLPIDSFSLFSGCNIQGEWKLSIYDYWVSDNGFLFNWYLEFDTITPQEYYNTSIWQGENINNDTLNTTFAIPTTTGLHPYTFTVESELNCTYDTTIYFYVDQTTKLSTIKLTIESKKPLNLIEIIDITGQVLIQQKLDFPNNIIIDVSALKIGIYFIEINNNQTIKFVKQ